MTSVLTMCIVWNSFMCELAHLSSDLSINVAGSWWRHQMETFSALLALCEGIPLTKASDAELCCFSICASLNGWKNSRDTGDLRHYRANRDVTVMLNNAECIGSAS